MSRHYETLCKVIAAWRQKDVDGVLLHFAEDIVWHFAAPALPPARGKAAAAKLLRRMCADMQDINWRIISYAEKGDTLFVEGVDTFQTNAGLRIALPYAGVLDFRDDLIAAWRDYVDLAVLESQKAGQPTSLEVEALIARAKSA